MNKIFPLSMLAMLVVGPTACLDEQQLNQLTELTNPQDQPTNEVIDPEVPNDVIDVTVPVINDGTPAVNEIWEERGSYAAFPPESTGFYDFAVNQKIYTLPGETRPIPTNDWWTDLLMNQYGGQLWAYPMMAEPTAAGVKLYYPDTWSGTSMSIGSAITITGDAFNPTEAAAKDWNDSGFTFSMPDGDKYLDVTLVHGMPFTWFESNGITPKLEFENFQLFSANGVALTESTDTDGIIIHSGGKYYGLHLPDNTKVEFTGAEKLILDLGSVTAVDSLNINWEGAFAKAYSVSVSSDNENWTSIFDESNGDGAVDTVALNTSAQYIQLTLNERGTVWPFSIWEMEVLSGATNVAAGKSVANIDGKGVETITTAMTDENLGTRWISQAQADQTITLGFAGAEDYFVISALTDMQDFNEFHNVAYSIPRDTRVDWALDQESGIVSSTWSFTTESLNGGGSTGVLQGFLPHHYNRTTTDFSFGAQEYMTGRGIMKLASGNDFTIDYPWGGLLPHLSSPVTNNDDSSPYDAAVMQQLITDYVADAGYGTDTYWGGKDLGRIARYMIIAKETNHPKYAYLRDMLKEALDDWLTYTPGEESRFFALYPKWGALIGFNESYYSGQFTDNHFHYGYFIYAAAMLGMVEPDWVSQYEEILTKITRQYANWERDSEDLPFLRTFDPWMGHSYAGGLSSGTGNNQESTSEATQSWAGMFFLGELLGNNDMRDAAAFGYISEAQATMEYWHNRSEEFFPEGYDKDILGIIWPAGLSYGTYFGDHPAYIYGIQWLPISPYLNYLTDGFDKTRAADLYDGLFVEMYNWHKDIVIPRSVADNENLTQEYADYQDLLATGGTLTEEQQTRYDGIPGWITGNENTIADAQLKIADGVMSPAEVGQNWMNVLWGYKLLSDPSYVADELDASWNSTDPLEHELLQNYYTGGLTYYFTHAMQNLGEVNHDISMSIPTSQAYFNPVSGRNAYVVFNYSNQEEVCRVYQHGAYIGEFKVPAHAQVTHYMDEALATIKIAAPVKTVVPGQQVQLSATGFDQYGATFPLDGLSFSVSSGGTISQNGIFTAQEYTRVVTVTATVGNVQQTMALRVADAPVLAGLEIAGNAELIEVGQSTNLNVTGFDQYGDTFTLGDVAWSVQGAGTIEANGVFTAGTVAGLATISATANGSTASIYSVVTSQLTNVALNKTVWTDGGDMLPAVNAVDGLTDTRWESSHDDNHWLAVNLGAPMKLTKVTINWEAAFASSFDIEVSDDAENWTTAASDLSGAAGEKTYSLSASGRYIRINCLTRQTEYGFSIFELEVYGYANPQDMAPNELFVNPTQWTLEKGVAKQFSAFVFDGDSAGGFVTPVWSAEGGSIDDKGVFIATDVGGPYTISATQNGVTATASVTVTQSGEGDSSGNNNGDDSANLNLALNALVTASSFENDAVPATNVIDGNVDTRWASEFSDDQWLALDLGSTQNIRKVVINWEVAYGSAYTLDISEDGTQWNTVFTETNSDGGVDEILLSENARFVRMNGTTRATAWGYSVLEFEVY